jgi:hypothetical protein
MIQFNEVYSLDQGKGDITFSEGKKGTINASYTLIDKQSKGVINGTLEGQLLKGTWHIDNTEGLIEITFHESGFEAKWKNGMEPGPMRGKWYGELLNNGTNNIDSQNNSTLEYIKYVKSNSYLSSAYEDVIDSTTDFVEDFSLEFDENFFGELHNKLEVVVFHFDNSEDSIEERNGSERFSVYYDFNNNCVYKQFPNEVNDYKCFLDTKHAAIPSFYEDSQEFFGDYEMSDLNEKWNIRFQGNFVSSNGNIDSNLLEKIKKNINGKSVYRFLNELIDSI